VVGFDVSPARREYALSFAVDRAVDPTGADGAAFPRRHQAGRLDTAIDCCGLKASVEYLMDVTGEVVALFGVQREDYTFAPRHYSQLKLCGYTGHYRAAAEYAVAQIEAGRLDLLPLVTHRLPFTEYDRAVDLLRRQEALKVCFVSA
jgi:threonine dehydrogenase-like Zn-dependent dehydrogenase